MVDSSDYDHRSHGRGAFACVDGDWSSRCVCCDRGAGVVLRVQSLACFAVAVIPCSNVDAVFRGQAKLKLRMSLAMIAMLMMAFGRIKQK